MQIIRHKTQQDWIWAHCRHSFIPCLWPTLASGQITLCLWEHLFLVSSAWLPGPFPALEAARYYNDPFWFLGFWPKFLNLYLIYPHSSPAPRSSQYILNIMISTHWTRWDFYSKTNIESLLRFTISNIWSFSDAWGILLFWLCYVFTEVPAQWH